MNDEANSHYFAIIEQVIVSTLTKLALLLFDNAKIPRFSRVLIAII